MYKTKVAVAGKLHTTLAQSVGEVSLQCTIFI